MLLRRYGDTVQGVAADFDPNALTEIGFRRDRTFSLPLGTFEERYEKLREEVLAPEADGPVQSEAEARLLAELEQGITGILGTLEEGEVVLVESAQGVDWPKVRDRKQGIIVDGENRLHFHWRVEPALRLGIYGRRGR